MAMLLRYCVGLLVNSMAMPHCTLVLSHGPCQAISVAAELRLQCCVLQQGLAK